MGPFGGIGLPEIIIVLVIVLVIFGPKRLPGLGRSLGSGLREFKDSVTTKESSSEQLGHGEETRSREASAARSGDEAPREEPEPVVAEPVSGGSGRSARDSAA